MKDSNINLIAIASKSNLAITDYNGEIPWRNKTDLGFFAEITRGNIVIMGNNTYKTLKG